MSMKVRSNHTDYVISLHIPFSLTLTDHVISLHIPFALILTDHVISLHIPFSLTLTDHVISLHIPFSLTLTDHVISLHIPFSLTLTDHVISLTACTIFPDTYRPCNITHCMYHLLCSHTMICINIPKKTLYSFFFQLLWYHQDQTPILPNAWYINGLFARW